MPPKKGKHNEKSTAKTKREDEANRNQNTPAEANISHEGCVCSKKKEIMNRNMEDCYCSQSIGEELVGTKYVTKLEATVKAGIIGSFQVKLPNASQMSGIFKGRSVLEPSGFDLNKTYWYGQKGSGFKSRLGKMQNFYDLRDHHINHGTLFEDPEFPPNNYSLFASPEAQFQCDWRRPIDICKNPQLFVDGFSRFDIVQGELGDCWLLAATANLTMHPSLFAKIVPDDQGFTKKYAGIFHFRFWQYGRWIDMVIDDKLPTDKDNKLIYLHSNEENEFWSALLEKAYAKLHGSYEALKGGSTCEAMEDFTGGVTEFYYLDDPPKDLFKVLEKAFEHTSLMGCSLEPDPEIFEAETPEGLVKGHAYSITKVIKLNSKIPMLRLRNPWGNDVEWRGAWSDNADEWKSISEDEKKKLGLVFDDDGEFWMSFQDWKEHFDRLEICNLNPDVLIAEKEKIDKRKWEMSVYEGAWVRGVTAGGCRNYLDTFWCNPQYRVTLTEPDNDDENNMCTCIVGLMQKNRRKLKLLLGEDLLTIGFSVYSLPNSEELPKPLNLKFFKHNASVARSPSFVNLRENSCRLKLPPGTYCIIPSTYEPNEESEFLLRIFSDHRNNMEENDTSNITFGKIDERIPTARKVGLVQSAPGKNTIKDVSVEVVDESRRKSLFNYDLLVGEDGAVDYLQLKTILDLSLESELRGKEFSTEITRSMVAMLDSDHSGKLDRQEFAKLWKWVQIWKEAFSLYDKDKSGTISGFELRHGLESAGYNLNNHILNIFMHRYGNEHKEIPIVEFMLCAIRLKIAIEKFEMRAKEDTILLTREEWIETLLYC